LVVLPKPYEEFREELANVKEIKKNIKIPFAAKVTRFFPPIAHVLESQALHLSVTSTLFLL